MSQEHVLRSRQELRARIRALPDLGLMGAMTPRGAVLRVGDGVALVSGLFEVGSEELVAFDGGALGIAYDLGESNTGIVLLSGAETVVAGQGALATGTPVSLLAGERLLGRVVDPLGRALDGHAVVATERRALFPEAPGLGVRASVTRPLLTGVTAIDAAVPVGCGQRQLIVGDRNVGKTALAMDIVFAQRHREVICVYAVIGQPLSRVLAIRDALSARDSLHHVVLVSAQAADEPGMQYLAPYAAMSIAEHFRSQGRDVLVVFDDLTKHADAYREMALVLGRPPGREAYPGDIFYSHAELLERATAFSDSAGGGSITALPIIETTDGDISAYIPTNLISITDGQLYLDAARFERNQRPAVDVGKSVSRIGGAAQARAMRSASRNLRIELSRFESLEAVTRVGLDVDPQTQLALVRGRRLRELLRQPRFTPRPPQKQMLALLAATHGWLDNVSIAEAQEIVDGAYRQLTESQMRALDEFGENDVEDDKLLRGLEQYFAGEHGEQ